AGGENYLTAAARRFWFAVLPPLHAGGALAVEQDGLGEAVGRKPQVAALKHRLEKAGRRRPAPTAPLVDVKHAAAFVIAGVEIRNRLDAGLCCRGAKGIENVPAHARRLDAPFAADAMRVAWSEAMILVALEKGQHVVPAPAGQAELAPVIVVGGLAAHVDHGIDSGRAADHLAAGIMQATAVEPFFRL